MVTAVHDPAAMKLASEMTADEFDEYADDVRYVPSYARVTHCPLDGNAGPAVHVPAATTVASVANAVDVPALKPLFAMK